MHKILEQLHSRGYAQIDETDPRKSTIDLANELAAITGTTASAAAGRLVASPVGVKPKNTYGGNYGYGPLPLHTDLAHWFRPPRYVLLRCIISAESVRTHIVHRNLLEDWIPKSLLEDAIFSPRRRLDGKLFLLRMFDERLIRWDQLFIKPQNRAAREVADRMQVISEKLPVSDVIFDRPGKTLIFDNWNILHGRSSVPSHEISRELDRVYFEE